MWEKIRPILLTVMFIWGVGNLPIWADSAIWKGLIALSPVICGVFYALDQGEEKHDRNITFKRR